MEHWRGYVPTPPRKRRRSGRTRRCADDYRVIAFFFTKHTISCTSQRMMFLLALYGTGVTWIWYSDCITGTISPVIWYFQGSGGSRGGLWVPRNPLPTYEVLSCLSSIQCAYNTRTHTQSHTTPARTSQLLNNGSIARSLSVCTR